MNENELDQILNEMRQETPEPGAEAAAVERVWEKLPACVHFRGQFGAYGEGRLGESTRQLLEDHLTRCAGCRRVLHPAAVVEMPVVAERRRFVVPKWAIAAGVAAVSLYLGRNTLDQALAPGGARATVESTVGGLYALHAGGLAKGAGIGDGDVVRTGAGARAHLRMADGSLIEVNERTELSMRAAWSGATIHLERGDVIVRAAKQRRGYLKVVTRDSEAAVKGTIFTVSAGMAGTLVGVVEGSVAVRQTGGERLLKPGEQATTSAALGKVSVRDAVAWSDEREKHFSLLAELVAIEKQLPVTAARTNTRLVKMLPPEVVVYAAIPNLGPAMNQAVELIEQRSADNAVLREWWGSRSAGEYKTLIGKMRTLAPMLGDEVVFALVSARKPLVMAEVKAGKAAELEAELKRLLPVGAAYRVGNGMLLISRTEGDLIALAGQLGQGAGTPFAVELANRYARGVNWMIGVDVAAVRMGGPVPDVKFAFVEQRTVQGMEENEAVVTFAGPRTGMAAWLAGPGSAGSAEYASADAVAVFSAATLKPRQILEEMTGMFPRIAESLREMEAKTGVNVINDVAATLGTDFTLSVETAAVPIPGVVFAMEVYQPATLNTTIGRVVEAYNREAGADRQLVMKQETVDGRTWHSLTLAGFGLQWTFDRGYWLVSLDRGVAARALATRAGGFPLIRSAQFREQMPTLAGVHPSGFAWLNLGPAAELISSFAPSAQVGKFLAIREPSLITFNGETERIQVASRTKLSSLMLDTMLNASAARKRGQ